MTHPKSPRTNSLLDRLWAEAEPIATHAFVVLILECSLLLIGTATKVLEYLFPKQAYYLEVVEQIDVWTALVLLSMFAAYTIAQVAIRLWKSLAYEVHSKEERLEAPSND